MYNLNCHCAEDRRFDSFFGWLRATQQCACNKWLAASQGLKQFTAVINAVWISISDPVEFFSKSSPIQIRFWRAESGWIAIRRPDHVQHWKLHTVTASTNRDHPTRSLYYCLFVSHIFVCCSLRTSRLWWTALSTQHQLRHQLRGCNTCSKFGPDFLKLLRLKETSKIQTE